MTNLIANEYKTFENIKQIKPDGTEYWSARELAAVLQYTEWRNFAKVIDKAMLACKNSGENIHERFVDVNKTLEMPNGAVKTIIDYELTRYACYLIVQNGDPRKEVIALGKPTLPFKPDAKKLLIILISSMRITKDWLSVAILNNGI